MISRCIVFCCFVLLFDGIVCLKVRVINLSGRQIPYKRAELWQKCLLQWQIDRQDPVGSYVNTDENKIIGHVILLQHDSVYTLGTASDKNFMKTSTSSTNLDLKYELFEIERGGQATYHGPGQIVMYPIIDLNCFEKDINVYLRGLEEITIQTLASYNIHGTRREGLTGVWVNDEKLCAIGIKLRRWVTMHGIALNVNPDMRFFDKIVPCGIVDQSLSVGSIAGCRPDLVEQNQISIEKVADKLRDKFTEHYQVQIEEVKGDEALKYLDNMISSELVECDSDM